MRFVADESCDFSVVRALRDAGHHVTAIAEIAPRIEDEEVLKLAHQAAFMARYRYDQLNDRGRKTGSRLRGKAPLDLLMAHDGWRDRVSSLMEGTTGLKQQRMDLDAT
jgi:uncharacterized protein DUF5615